MIAIRMVTPTNLSSERERFLADPTHNPQFTYEEPIVVAELTEHGIPQPQIVEQAQEVLDRAYFGRNEADLMAMQGQVCSHQQVLTTAQSFLDLHHLSDTINVKFSSSFHSRATMSATTLKIRLPIDFRREGLLSALYHEVGTHALRTINYQQQPWYKKKKKYQFGPYLRTEEGLAALHGLIPLSYKLNYVGALKYLTIHWGQQYSFLEVWQRLGKYVQNPDRRWIMTSRAKRGLTDTSQPGGFSKDLVYFEGMLEVWRWLRSHNFDPTLLYYGKFGYADVEKAIQHNPAFQPQLPSFYLSSPQLYAQQLLEIGQINMIE